MSKSIIAYYRVSTDRQGKSKLGLEGQESAVQQFAKSNGFKIIAAYTEVESGKRSDRTQLANALGHAKRSKARLVVAKLDRLARNVAFTSALMESGVDFVACDNPHANRLTIHILAAVAEHEARQTSERTKTALAAYKARGGKLGASRPECRNLSQKARKKGAAAAGEAVRRKADAAYADLKDRISEMRFGGATYQEIADALNDQGHTTQRGKPWSHVAVMRVCKRYGIAA
jgi:DNA invertase Pin-like site-specific DNA recombinase